MCVCTVHLVWIIFLGIAIRIWLCFPLKLTTVFGQKLLPQQNFPCAVTRFKFRLRGCDSVNCCNIHSPSHILSNPRWGHLWKHLQLQQSKIGEPNFFVPFFWQFFAWVIGFNLGDSISLFAIKKASIATADLDCKTSRCLLIALKLLNSILRPIF